MVAKKATAVVDVVRNIAEAALGSATDATSSTLPLWFSNRAFFHLSTETKTSSAPIAVATKIPIKFVNEKLFGWWWGGGEVKKRIVRLKHLHLVLKTKDETQQEY